MLGNLPPAPGAPLAPHMDRLPAWLPSQLAAWGVTLQQYIDTISAAVYDQATAVNWLGANAATYNIDPDQLFAGGYSAGAVSSLAMGAGIIDGMPDVNLTAIYSLAGALFGWESAIDSSMPPTFLIHGTNDTVVPYSEEAYLQPALAAAGVPYEALIIPGAGHSDSLLSNGVISNQQMLFEFFAEQMLVPEPTSLSLLLVGTAVVGMAWRRRRASAGAPRGN
jgi:acetyl esterase/lipase